MSLRGYLFISGLVLQKTVDRIIFQTLIEKSKTFLTAKNKIKCSRYYLLPVFIINIERKKQ